MFRPFRVCALHARRLSTASSPYENYTKLRAFPFWLSPQEAQRWVSPLAALACDPAKAWPSFLKFIMPFLNINFLRPTRFSAVYFPAWFVNGEVEARITYENFQEVKLSALFEDTYIPGFHMAVLSAAPLSSSSLLSTDTVPFTTSLLHQHGETVECIPFSTSPFSALDIAASQSQFRSIAINESLSINLSSVKSNLMAAYPVLIPLYLAQYEMKDGKNDNNMFTVLIKAHGPLELSGIMFDSESYSKINDISKLSFKSVCEIFNPGFNEESEVSSIVSNKLRVSMPRISINKKTVKNSISEWLEELLSSSKNIEILAKNSLGVIEKGDVDLRMREMTEEEKISMSHYATLTKKILHAKGILNLYSEIDAMGIGKGVSTPNWLVKTKTTLEIPVKRLETLRAEVEPKWWSEWLALNQPESENTVNKGGVEKEKK